MSVEFVKVASPQVGDDEIAAVAEVLRSGRYVSGPKVKQFEQRFAEHVGVAHVVAVNSGTAAIQAALAALGIGPGDEVIVPALTFFSTATAVIHQNAIPVFADISLANFSLDPDDFVRRVTPRTKAVIPVHYFGHAAEMDGIIRTAAEHDIAVIEDCAQAHGTVYKGKVVGSIGQMGAFSFFATKHITTGEGGAVTTDNPDWAEYIRRFRSHGMAGRHDHVMLGYNYRMTEIAAALGIVQMDKLDALNAARIRHSEYLIEHLHDIPWLSLPEVPDYVTHTYFWCHILIDEDVLGFDTQSLIARLRERGIETRNRYLEPLYKQPLLNNRDIYPLNAPHYTAAPDYGSLYLPNAERAAGRVIGLPNRPDMTRAELDKVIDVLHTIRS